jgi:mevalonate kinase
VGAVPRDAACAALVGSLAARVKSGDRAARTSIEALGRIAADAARILLSDASAINEAFGILAGRAMDQLRAIGLSTPELDQLLEAAKAAGALGGKLSGAGAGGAFFAVARDRPTASLIVSRLESAAAAGGLALASPLRVIQA